MKVIVTAGLSDYKLSTKLAGLINNQSIEEILLVRKEPLNGFDRIKCITPAPFIAKFTPFFEAWRLITLIKLARKENVSAIIGIQLIIHGIQARLAGWLAGRPVVIGLIGKDVHMYLCNHWSKWLLRPFVKTADCVTVMGDASGRIVAGTGVPLEKIHIIQNFQDDGKFYHQNIAKVYDIIYIGQLIPRKCVDILVRALHKLSNNYNLVIVGSGPEYRHINNLVNSLGMEENVKFAGEVINVEDYLNKSRLLVLPSNMEALPAVAIEAMYCGTPAVLPDICDIPTYFGKGKESILFKPGDFEDLANKIKFMLSGNTTYADRVSACIEWAEQHMMNWSLETQTTLWDQILATALNK